MNFITSLFKKQNSLTQSRKKNKYATTEDIAIYFNISKKSIEDIFTELHWIDEDKLPTEQGIKYGAVLKDEAILQWNKSILSNETFIGKINAKINTLIFALSQNYTKEKNISVEYPYIA